MARHIQFVILCVCLFYIVNQTIAKTFGTCELARELRRQGFPEHELSDWICLVQGESSGRTGVRGGPNSDGSYDYGLFQINDRYWCNNGGNPGKGCGIRCADLLSDDITIASRCAMKIRNTQGLSAWVAWNNKCSGKPLPRPPC